MTGTAPIEPPSRVNTSSLPKPTRYASRTSSASAPLLTPLYGSSPASTCTSTSGKRSAINARMRSNVAGQVMFGTSQHDTFTSALGAIDVLTPGATYPPTTLCTSNVGSAHSRRMTSSGSVERIDDRLTW